MKLRFCSVRRPPTAYKTHTEKAGSTVSYWSYEEGDEIKKSSRDVEGNLSMGKTGRGWRGEAVYRGIKEGVEVALTVLLEFKAGKIKDGIENQIFGQEQTEVVNATVDYNKKTPDL